jgi:PhnB protein
VKKPVKPVPEDFRTITPHLVVQGVSKAVDFYRRAFGAEELYRNLAPDGVSVMHSELLLGDSRFFVNDEFPDHGVFAPRGEYGTGLTLHLYVPNVDAFYERAVAAGVEVIFPLADCFWGDRYCIFKDPFGHRWSVASRIEDLSPQEIHERSTAFRPSKPD